MCMVVRFGLWLGVAFVSLCALLAGTPHAAAEPFSKEVLLSLLRPSDHPGTDKEKISNIEKILSVPLTASGRKKSSRPLAFKEPRTTSDYGWDITALDHFRAFPPPRELAPGIPFSAPSRTFARIASLQPAIHATKRTITDLIDSGASVASAGSLVHDPRWVYSALQIEVDRSKFTLKLIGFRKDRFGTDHRSLLYASKVGLGSAEFPTPRGQFYITRIYDDHPLWIPPDRWWAWGQRPSHSVYGGHMMPFFKKQLMSDPQPMDNGQDKVAPRVKLFDAGMYRIHGTDSPWSVGSNQSHGCVRMKNETVAKLANNLKMYAGTTHRGHSANGTYVDLARPVKLILH
jgi:L,D-transpeptidase ErfK/SrfK